MATRALGRDAYAAYVKGVTWGTEVLAGARTGMEIVEETAGSEIATIRDPSFNGSSLPFPGDAGDETVEGFVNVNMKFEDKSLQVIAQIMGAAATPIAEGDLQLHVLTLAANNDGQFGTLVIGRVFEVWEYDSIKPNAFEITNVPGDEPFALCTFDGIGRSMSRNTDVAPVGAVNTPTTFLDVTSAFRPLVGGVKRLLLFKHLKVYYQLIDDDGVFDATDEICISDFTFRLERPQEGDRTTCNEGLPEEPSETDFAQITGSFVIPAYNSDHGVIWDLGRSKAVIKMKLEWKLTVDVDNVYRFSIFLPAVQTSNDGPIADNPGKLPFTLNIDGWRAPSGAPDGFDFDKPYIEIVNGYDADDLLEEAAYTT